MNAVKGVEPAAPGRWQWLAVNAGLALACWGLAWSTYALFGTTPAWPLPFWPGTALALVAAILGSWRWMPGIVLGNLLGQHGGLGLDWPLASALALSLSLAPFWAGWEIRRRCEGRLPLFGVGDVMAFVGFGAFLAPALSSLAGVWGLLLWQQAAPGDLASLWLRAWVAEACAALLLAPLLLSLQQERRLLPKERLPEYCLASGLALALTAAVFFGVRATVHPVIGLHFLLLLPLAWIAIRFSLRSLAWILLLVIVTAAWGTLDGLGPFVHAGNAHPLLTVGLLGLSLGAAGMFLSAISGERLRVLASLAASEARQRSILETATAGIALADFQGNLLEVNPAYARLLGYTPEAMIGVNIKAFSHPEDMAVEWAYLEAIARAERDSYQMEKRYHNQAGEELWVDLSVGCLRDEHGQPGHLIGVINDITARKADQARLHLMGEVFRHAGEAILVTDRDNRIVMVNQAFTALTGYSPEEVLGQNPRLLSAGNTPAEVYQRMWAAIRERGHWQGEVWDRRKDGVVYPKLLSIAVLRNAAGQITHHIAGFTDISEHKAAEHRIRYLALHDTLTGLPNRMSLLERLEQSLQTSRRRGEMLGVMFIDLDRFKLINDTLGHHAGDELLIQLARRLKSAVRSSDVVARLGGDEFVVVVTGAPQADDVLAVARSIAEALRAPYELDGRVLHTTPSIGVSLFPQDGEDVTTLMRNADTAMYHAKSQGRNNIQCYDLVMNEAATERLELENNLPRALERGEFVLHYQPQIAASSGNLVGVEALLRWQDPEHGLIPPDRFIPVAEETGFIVALGHWVLEEACRQRRAWYDAGLPAFHIAVNLSAVQLQEADLVAQVGELLARYRLGPGDLELEITESAAMGNPMATISTLKAIKTMGIPLAIDDFGTGYSSLAYLKLLPIDTLKLDRSFVKDIEKDEDDAVICSATIALAHALGLSVVAEGVETQVQQAYLQRLKCDQLQGYRFSRPLSATQLEPLLRQWLHGEPLPWQQ